MEDDTGENEAVVNNIDSTANKSDVARKPNSGKEIASEAEEKVPEGGPAPAAAAPVAAPANESEGDESEDDEGDLTFVKGDCKHTVASSTLSSLVAMLEKESSRSKGRFRSELPTIAASPATTSFLSGTKFNGKHIGFGC